MIASGDGNGPEVGGESVEDRSLQKNPFSDESRITMTVSAKPLRLPEDDASTTVESTEPLGLPRLPAGLAPGADTSTPRVLRLPDEAPRSLAPAQGLGALDLIDHSVPQPPFSPEVEMTERFALGDFSGSLRLAELILGGDSRHTEALRIAGASRAALVAHYCSRLGGIEAHPRLVVDRTTLGWLGVDERAKTLLDHLDGHTSLGVVLEQSSFSPLDTLKILIELVDVQAIRS